MRKLARQWNLFANRSGRRQQPIPHLPTAIPLIANRFPRLRLGSPWHSVWSFASGPLPIGELPTEGLDA